MNNLAYHEIQAGKTYDFGRERVERLAALNIYGEVMPGAYEFVATFRTLRRTVARTTKCFVVLTTGEKWARSTLLKVKEVADAGTDGI